MCEIGTRSTEKGDVIIIMTRGAINRAIKLMSVGENFGATNFRNGQFASKMSTFRTAIF